MNQKDLFETGMALPAMHPFFKYYGGKWRDVAKHYPVPEYDTIVEPFAGAAGYAVRYADRKIILGEKDEKVFGVWDYLIRASVREILALPDLADGESIGDLPVCEEAQWLVGFWLNSGVPRPRQTPSKWMQSGIHTGCFWGDLVRKRIAKQVDRVRHWRVLHCSFEDLPFSDTATWFIDPPYEIQGKHYFCGSRHLDYSALGEWCQTRPGQVIACENEGASWLPFEPLASVRTSRRGSFSKEVIWHAA